MPFPSSGSLVGHASWYGAKFHGRQTASGEVYDMHALTAAHRTLPFQTQVRVLNLDNRRSTVVRITDRGPFVKGRIIDLSLAAAKEIGLVESGTARVQLSVLRFMPTAEGSFFVQLGSFRDSANAHRLMTQVQAKFPAQSIKIEHFQGFSRVWAGPWTEEARADRELTAFSREGFSGFVLRR